MEGGVAARCAVVPNGLPGAPNAPLNTLFVPLRDLPVQQEAESVGRTSRLR